MTCYYLNVKFQGQRVKDRQMLGATVQNFVAQTIWSPEFLHPCSNVPQD